MATLLINAVAASLGADVVSDIYNLPDGAGRYAFAVQAYSTVGAQGAQDYALFMQTTPDGGTTWIDMPWTVHLITADATTTGTLTTTPARNIFKYTTSPATTPGDKIIAIYDLPDTQIRFKYKWVGGTDLAALKVWLLHYGVGPA